MTRIESQVAKEKCLLTPVPCAVQGQGPFEACQGARSAHDGLCGPIKELRGEATRWLRLPCAYSGFNAHLSARTTKPRIIALQRAQLTTAAGYDPPCLWVRPSAIRGSRDISATAVGALCMRTHSRGSRLRTGILPVRGTAAVSGRVEYVRAQDTARIMLSNRCWVRPAQSCCCVARRCVTADSANAVFAEQRIYLFVSLMSVRFRLANVPRMSKQTDFQFYFSLLLSMPF